MIEIDDFIENNDADACEFGWTLNLEDDAARDELLKNQEEACNMKGFLEEFGCKDWYEWGALYTKVAQDAWKFTYLEEAWKKIDVDLDDAGDCMKFCKEYKRIREGKDE